MSMGASVSKVKAEGKDNGHVLLVKFVHQYLRQKNSCFVKNGES